MLLCYQVVGIRSAREIQKVSNFCPLVFGRRLQVLLPAFYEHHWNLQIFSHFALCEPLFKACDLELRIAVAELQQLEVQLGATNQSWLA